MILFRKRCLSLNLRSVLENGEDKVIHKHRAINDAQEKFVEKFKNNHLIVHKKPKKCKDFFPADINSSLFSTSFFFPLNFCTSDCIIKAQRSENHAQKNLCFSAGDGIAADERILQRLQPQRSFRNRSEY